MIYLNNYISISISVIRFLMQWQCWNILQKLQVGINLCYSTNYPFK